MAEEETGRKGPIRNPVALLTAALILAYAVFVQWIWGWPSILAAWREVGGAATLYAWTVVVRPFHAAYPVP